MTCTVMKHGCFGRAVGYRCKRATGDELRFLRAAGALLRLLPNSHGLLIPVDVAIRAGAKAGAAAALLEAMAGIPELQPYTAPVPQAQPRLDPGVTCMPLQLVNFQVTRRRSPVEDRLCSAWAAGDPTLLADSLPPYVCKKPKQALQSASGIVIPASRSKCCMCVP